LYEVQVTQKRSLDGLSLRKGIDGICIGDPYKRKPKYLTVGEGVCVDAMGKRMPAQQGTIPYCGTKLYQGTRST